MESNLTLRERYEQINDLLYATKDQRNKLYEACKKVSKQAKLYEVASKILYALTKLETTELANCLAISTKYYVKTEFMIEESQKEELQKILDEYSPEKIQIIQIKTEKNIGAYSTSIYTEIEVELIK